MWWCVDPHAGGGVWPELWCAQGRVFWVVGMCPRGHAEPCCVGVVVMVAVAVVVVLWWWMWW